MNDAEYKPGDLVVWFVAPDGSNCAEWDLIKIIEVINKSIDYQFIVAEIIVARSNYAQQMFGKRYLEIGTQHIKLWSGSIEQFKNLKNDAEWLNI